MNSLTPLAVPGSLRADPVQILARTIWGEAHDETVRGKEAIASVILNRVARAKERGGWWWGEDVVSVCRKPGQFPCWDGNDGNRAKFRLATEGDQSFIMCLRIARRAVAGSLDDPTGGATHYHRLDAHPPWAWRLSPCAEIGHYLFYDTVE